jgi:hypothetical protein
MSSPAVSYEEQWREYRRRRLVGYGLWIGWLPYGGTLIYLQDSVAWIGRNGVPLAVGYMLAACVAGLWLSFWPCPSCGRPFFLTTFWFYRHFAKACVHCGLPKWAQGGADPWADRA